MKSDPSTAPPPHLGDMPPEELRESGHATVDWIADYFSRIETFPVLARVAPGEIAAHLPTEAPEEPTPINRILAEVDELLPGITHWNHPGFFAYFSITASGPGILGEMLAAALNVNAMLWRTSPAATELEERSLDWLRQMLGLPAVFCGTIQDTASLSSLTAIAAAREALELDIREQGMSGRELPRLRLYCSEEAHSSIEKAGITLGIGRQGTRRIATDAELRMDSARLETAIERDLANGDRPFCVVATLGTTSTTAIDPIAEIAEICARYGLWLHVDAAYGGAAALLPEMRERFRGWERADSIVVNPHKWLFVPIDCSALLVRNPEIVRRAFSLVPEYLSTPEGEAVTNLMDYGPALGRRFRALKLWMTMRYFGRAGMAARIREHMALAREFAGWVDEASGWRRLAPVEFSVVVFRFQPEGTSDVVADVLNERILDAVNATGEAYLSHTRVCGRFAMRLAIGNLRTGKKHVARAWELLCEQAAGALATDLGSADSEL